MHIINPFAHPTHRFHGDATATTKVVAANSNDYLDYTTANMAHAMSGGEIIYTGWQMGDYVTMAVVVGGEVVPDTDYIKKRFLKADGSYHLDLRPLIAELPATTTLRVTYFTTAAGGNREFCVNFDLFHPLLEE